MAGDKTLTELAQRFEMHPEQIEEWKRHSANERPMFLVNLTVVEPIVDLTLENDLLESALTEVELLGSKRLLTATVHFH